MSTGGRFTGTPTVVEMFEITVKRYPTMKAYSIHLKKEAYHAEAYEHIQTIATSYLVERSNQRHEGRPHRKQSPGDELS